MPGVWNVPKVLETRAISNIAQYPSTVLLSPFIQGSRGQTRQPPEQARDTLTSVDLTERIGLPLWEQRNQRFEGLVDPSTHKHKHDHKPWLLSLWAWGGVGSCTWCRSRRSSSLQPPPRSALSEVPCHRTTTRQQQDNDIRYPSS